MEGLESGEALRPLVSLIVELSGHQQTGGRCREGGIGAKDKERSYWGKQSEGRA